MLYIALPKDTENVHLYTDEPPIICGTISCMQHSGPRKGA